MRLSANVKYAFKSHQFFKSRKIIKSNKGTHHESLPVGMIAYHVEHGIRLLRVVINHRDLISNTNYCKITFNIY
jgi:hypothetical protein